MSSSNTPQETKRTSPLRGLAIALVIALVIFPDARESIVSAVGTGLALVVGAALAGLVLLGGSGRHR